MKTKSNTEENTTALPPQFKSWNRTNAVGRASAEGVRSISIGKNGAFVLSKTLSDDLKLKPGAAVCFHQDDTKDEWYLERDDKEGLVLRADSQERLVFNSTALYYGMKPQFPDDLESGRALVAKEPTRVGVRLLYSILLSSMKQGRQRKA